MTILWFVASASMHLMLNMGSEDLVPEGAEWLCSALVAFGPPAALAGVLWAITGFSEGGGE
jgi:hypothetical protein